MILIKEFRKANGISQMELANYLGVTQGLVSQFEKGITKVSTEVLEKLISNPNNWDTSMLMGEGVTIHQKGKTNVIGNENKIGDGAKDEMIDILRKEVDKLLGELEEQKETNRRYLAIIENLSKKEQ